MEKGISIAQLKEVVQEAYEHVKTNTEGKNADYIPYLASVDKYLFGISICLLDRQTIHIGDADYRFGVESVSKVHTVPYWHFVNTEHICVDEDRCRRYRTSVQFHHCCIIGKPSTFYAIVECRCYFGL